MNKNIKINFMQKYLIICISIFCASLSFAQTVNFKTPNLSNRQYFICAFQGAQTDTLARGIVPPDGIFSFKMPAQYANYCGILRFEAGADKWNCVMNSENFTVINEGNNLKIEQSTENEIFIKKQTDFASVCDKVEFIYKGLPLFPENSQLVAAMNSEFVNQNKIYSAMYSELTRCQLYACKYIEIQRFTNGYAQRLFLPAEKKQNYAALLAFYSDSLKIDDLYTSDLYSPAQKVVLKLMNSTAQYGELMVKKMQQIRSDNVFRAFADDLATQCQRNSWADAEDMIAQYLVNSNRLDKFSFAYKYSAEVLKGKIGNSAHKIDGVKSLKNTILFFYESDCPHCVEQIAEFKKYYAQLQSKGIQVISIASDTEPTIYKELANTFEWENKFCDFQGFEGKIFNDYGVRSTPVIFYIDKNEKIIGRYARLKETKLIE